MNRDDYLGFMRRALEAPHGVKLEFDSDREADLVRKKCYHIRDEERAAARVTPLTEPAATFDTNGKVTGIVEILRPQPSFDLDRLWFRVHAGNLYILPTSLKPRRQRRRVDELPRQPGHEVSERDLYQLPHWPTPHW